MDLDKIKKLNLGQAKEDRIIALIKVCERTHITYNLQKMARLSRNDLVTLKHSCLAQNIPEWAEDIVKLPVEMEA